MGGAEVDGLNGPGNCRSGGQHQQGEMEHPARTLRKPMSIEISDKECRLKEYEAGDPDCGRTAEYRQQLLGRDRLDRKSTRRREKHSATEERSDRKRRV